MDDLLIQAEMNYRDRDLFCPVCHSDRIAVCVLTIEKTWRQNYPVHFCRGCGLYYLDDKPGEAEVEALYREEYYKKNPGLLKSWFRHLRSRSQYDWIRKETRLRGKKTVLEVGAGDGALLHMFSLAGHTVRGIEYNRYITEEAYKEYGLKLERISFFDTQGKFDLILMSHVFEHFLDLQKVLDHAKNNLQKGGYVFIEVPNCPPYNACSAEELRECIQRFHIYNFTVESVKLALEKNHFHIKSIQRFFYQLPDGASHRHTARRKQMGRLLNGGRRTDFHWVLLPHLLYYLGFSLFFPKKSYQKIPNHNPWYGKGDNIRVLASLYT